jgi:2-amino-4-hydroxy-6-hydroxymethyldihydropteridine diphosphokinase
VAVGLGSNLGDRRAHLVRGVEGLGEAVSLEALSSTYESDAVGFESQPPFLNAILVGTTELGPEELLARARRVETEAGRKRSFRNAPRTLDLDLILYGGLTLVGPDLHVPHPRFRDRAFVLAPLVEVAPAWVDPVSGRTVLEIWDERRESLPPARVVAPPPLPPRSQP